MITDERKGMKENITGLVRMRESKAFDVENQDSFFLYLTDS